MHAKPTLQTVIKPCIYRCTTRQNTLRTCMTSKYTKLLRRDIVDTSNHASCVFGHNTTKQVGFPTIWEGSGKKKWDDLLSNTFNNSLESTRNLFINTLARGNVFRCVCYSMSTKFVRRDIVDTSNHASCVFGHNTTKQVGFPTIWEGSGKKKWDDLLSNTFNNSLESTRNHSYWGWNRLKVVLWLSHHWSWTH
jgi:hypothetical protein